YQALHFMVEKMMGVGCLPDVDLTLANFIFVKVCDHIKRRTDIEVGMRSHGRIINQIRTMVITDALNQLYFSSSADRPVINETTLRDIKPYIFAQVHHCVFGLTLLMDQLFDPYYNCMLYCVISTLGKFPVGTWVTRLAAPKPIDRVSARRQVNRIEACIN